MKYARMAVFYVLAMLAHWWWTTYLSFFGLAPQILLVLTIVAAAREGPIPAMAFGFAWGVAMDIFSAHLMGATSLALTAAGYLVGRMRRQVDVASIAPQCVIAVVATWSYFLFLGLMGMIFLRHFGWPGWAMFLLAPVYNCLMAPLLYRVWDFFVGT